MRKKTLLPLLFLLLALTFPPFLQHITFPSPFQGPAYEWSEQDQLIKSQITENYYSGLGGTKNYYAQLSNPKNPIPNPLILVVGLEDIPENWWKTAQKAIERGLQKVYIFEIRGQGRSQRVPGNKVGAAHVEKFEDYSHDFLLFLKHLKEQGEGPQAPPFILAHSTGSLVVSSALNEIKNKYPKFYPAALSFWAPLIKLKSSPILVHPLVLPVIEGINSFYEWFGVKIFVKFFTPRKFENNHVTNNKDFFTWSEKIRQHEKLMSSGVTLRWAIESIKASQKLLASNYSVLDRPCLIFTARKDEVVDNHWMIDNPKIKTVSVKGAKHALHTEKAEVFDPMFRKTMEFFFKHK